MRKLDEIKQRHERAEVPYEELFAPLAWVHAHHDRAALIEMVEALQREIAGYRAFKNSADEALNSGDGTYRP